MSLQVWLPLNGDLRNNGLSNVTVTNNGATVDNAGKIGKCYYFNGSSHIRISLPPELTSIKNSSVCAWVKSTGSTVALGGISSNSTYAYPMMTLYTSGWQFAGTSAYKYISGGSIANSGVWHHVCCTAADDVVTTYLDGVVVASKTYSEIGTDKWVLNPSINFIEIGCDHPGGDEYLTGYVNDFRVYNHCLSVKEVKELSKGLVAHYKLDQPFVIDNLVRNSTYVAYNNYSGSGSTATVTATGEYYNGCTIYRLTYTPNDTSINNVRTTLASHGIYGFRTTFAASTKYCFWILYKPISHSDTICGGTASNIGGWTEIAPKDWGDGWKIVGQYRNGSVTTAKTDNIFTSFKTPSATSGTPITIDFCCPHLIKDYDYIMPEWDYIGSTNTIIYDCSGYNNNGVSNGTFSLSNDTTRYSASTIFNGTNNQIEADPLPAETQTISIWTKTSWTSSSGYRLAVHDKVSGLAIGWSANQLITYVGSSNGGSGSRVLMESSTYTANQWNHIAVVKTGSTTRNVYINGVLVTPTSVNYWGGDLNKLNIGSRHLSGTYSGYFNGQLSDFRAYSTALSADDIKELYQTSASIDKNGNMYGYELREV